MGTRTTSVVFLFLLAILAFMPGAVTRAAWFSSTDATEGSPTASMALLSDRPIVTLTSATYYPDSDALNITYTVDKSLVPGQINLTFRIIVEMPVDFLTLTGPMCVSGTSQPYCVQTDDTNTIYVPNVDKATNQFLVNMKPKSYNAVETTIRLVVEEHQVSGSVLVPGNPTFSLVPRIGMYYVTASPRVRFEAEDTTSRRGTLIYALDVSYNTGAVKPTVLSPDHVVYMDTLNLSLSGWTLGVCRIATRAPGQTKWILRLPTTPLTVNQPLGSNSAMLTMAERVTLSTLSGIYVICDDSEVSPNVVSSVAMLNVTATDEAYRLWFQPVSVAYNHAAQTTKPSYYGWESWTNDDPTAYDMATVSALVTNGFAGMVYRHTHINTSVRVTVAVRGHNRAFISLLSTDDVMRDLFATVLLGKGINYSPNSGAGGLMGTYVCDVSNVRSPCRMLAPGCSSLFAGRVVCEAAYSESMIACNDPEIVPPTPTPSYDSCPPGVVSDVIPTYNAINRDIKYAIKSNITLYNGDPTVQVTLTTEPKGVFDWGATTGLCDYWTQCVYSREQLLVSFQLSSQGSTQFTVSCKPIRWARSVKITFDAVVLNATSPSSIVSPSVAKTYDTRTAINVYPFTATVAASFARGTDVNHPERGTLLLSVENASGAGLEPATPVRGPILSLVLTLLAGWTTGAACSLYTRPLGGSSWVPRVPIAVTYDSAAGAFIVPAESALQLNAISGAYLACPGSTVSPSAPGLYEGTISVGFAGAADAFLSEVTAGVTATVVDAEDARSYYVGFTAAVDASVSASDLAALQAAVTRGLTLSSATLARTSDGAVEGVIALRGSDRAFLPLLAPQSRVESLLVDVLSTPEHPWALTTGSISSGPSGLWRCFTAGSASAGEACAMTPPGCSTAFQSEPLCWRDGAERAYACHPSLAVEAKPVPVAESDFCYPRVTDLDAEYFADTGLFSVNYTVQVNTHLPPPGLTFVIATNGGSDAGQSAGILTLADPSCTDDSACTAEPLAGGSISIAVNAVPSGNGMVSLTGALRAWARAGRIVVTVMASGTEVGVVADRVPTTFLLPADLGVFTVPAPSVFFSPSSAADRTGTLILALSAAAAGGALAPAASAALGSGTLNLPAGWELGTECTARHTASGASLLWPLAAPATATPPAVTPTGGLTFLDATGPSAGDIERLYLICDGVVPPSAATTGGQISVSLQGADGAYLVEAAAAALDYTPLPAAAADATQYIGFTLTLTPSTVAEVRAETYEAAALAGRAGLALRWTRDGAAFHVAIQLAGPSRVFVDLMSAPAAVASLAADVLTLTGGEDAPAWALPADAVIEAGDQGSWQCVDAGAASGYAACAEAPEGCSDAFQGNVSCLTAANALSLYACAFAAPQRAAAADYSACDSVVTALNASYSGSTTIVTYTIDTARFVGNPTFAFTLHTEANGIFDWSNPNCPAGVTCTYDTPVAVLTATFAAAAATGSFVVEGPVMHWAKSGSIEVGVTVSGSDTNSILADDVPSSFPLTGPVGVFEIAPAAAAVTASFAADGVDTPLVGTLIVAITGTTAALLPSEARAVSSVLVSLPADWQLGAACDVRVAAATAPHWLLAVPALPGTTVAGSAIRLAAPGFLLSTARAVYVICAGVTAAGSGDLAISFEGAVGAFVAEVKSTATVAADTVPATEAAAYIGFALQLDAAVDVTTPAFATAIGANILEASARRTATDVKAAVRLAGGDRAYSVFLATESSVTVLAASLASGGTLSIGTLESGTEGSWQCVDAGAPSGYAVCAEAPKGCSDAFQGAVNCISGVDLRPSEFACAFIAAERAPVSDYSACSKIVTPLNVSFADSAVTLTYSIDANAFQGNPTFAFTLRTEPANIFDWSAPACPAGIACTYDADTRTLTAAVASAAATGQFVFATVISHWAKAGTFAVGATIAGRDGSILADGPSTFALAKPIAVYSAAAALTAAFAPAAAATPSSGTLIVAVTSASPLYSAEARAARTLTLSLPSDWRLGVQCDVRVATAAGPHWLLSVPTLSPVAVDAASSAITLPAAQGLTLNTARAVYVVCTGVTAAASGTVAVGFEGGSGVYLAQVSGTATAAADTIAASDAVSYVGFALTLSDSVDVSAPAFATAVGADTLEVVATRGATAGAAIKTTIGFTGGDRAYLDFLAGAGPISVLAGSLAADGAYVTGSLETGMQGAWLCESPSPAYAPCEITPHGCGKAFQGAVTCIADAGAAAPSEFACVLSSMLPAPVPKPDYDACEPRVASFDVHYSTGDNSVLSVNFTVNSAANFLAEPTLVFTLIPSVDGLFDWAGEAPCDGCSYTRSSDAGGAGLGSLAITMPSVSGSAVFTVPSALARWAKNATVTVGAALLGSDSSIVLVDTETVFALPASLGVATVTPAVATAVFVAGSGTAPYMGTLIVSLDTGTAAALSAEPRAVGTVHLELPVDWALGAECSLLSRHTDGPAWLPALPAVASDSVAGAAVAFSTAAPVLSGLAGVRFLCTGVTPAAAAGAGITVRFEGAASRFLVDITPAVALTFDPAAAAADTFHRYVRFQLSASAAADAPTAVALAEQILGVRADTLLFTIGTDDDDVYTVNIGLAGADRALIPFLTDADALAGLASAVLTPVGAWSLVAGSTRTGVQGAWLCETDSAGALTHTTCALTPPGCSQSFQGPVRCVAQGAVSQFACGLFTEPRADIVTDLCKPALTSFSADYESTGARAGTVTVTYAIDAPSFLAQPGLTFTLTSSVPKLFNWSAVSSGTGAGGCGGDSCSYNEETGALTVTVNRVTAGATFTVVCNALHWERASTIAVRVGLAGSADSTLASDTADVPAQAVSSLTGTALSAVFAAETSATTGTLLIAVAPAASSALGAGTEQLASVSVTLPAGWALGSECTAYNRGPADSLWLPSLSGAPSSSVAAGVVTAPFTRSAASTAALYLFCTGVTPAEAAAGTVAIAIEGVGAAYLIESSAAALSYTAAGTSAAGAYAGFMLTSSAALPDGMLEVSVRGSGIFSTLPINVTSSTAAGGAYTVTLGLAGGARVYAGFLTAPDALTSLVDSLSGDWAYTAGSARTGALGQWLCGSDTDGYLPCVIANGCGDAFARPVTCTDADGVEAAAAPQHACALDAEPVPVDRRGCGRWLCKDEAGAFVDCSDARVCVDGCAEAVELSDDLIAADPRLQSFCVATLDSVDTAVDGSLYCPTGFVTAPVYASIGTCNATSACRLSCMDAEGTAKHCDSDLAWSECTVSEHGCGNGLQNRYVYCAPETFPIGTNTTQKREEGLVVDAALCSSLTPAFKLTRECSGAYCVEYEWQCDDGKGGLVPCVDGSRNDIDTGYSGCAGVCGYTTQTRNVRCVSFITDRTVKSTTTDERLCLARAPKPATSKPCISSTCSHTEWRCYPAAADPVTATAAACADDAAFQCPVYGCVASAERRRGVACVDVATGARVADGNCAASGQKPVQTTQCGAVDTACTVDFTGAACTFTAAGEPYNDGEAPACVATAGDDSGVFKQGACIDTVSGALSAGACTDAALLSECVLPTCGENIAFEWESDEPTGVCTPGCVSYRPRGSVCYASTDDGEPIAVDDSFCGAKPAGYAACEAAPCDQGGVCVTEPVLIDGQVNYDISGTCDCTAGYGGALCETNATFASFSVRPLEGLAQWTFENGDVSPFVSFVSVYAASTESALNKTLLAIVPATSSSASKSPLAPASVPQIAAMTSGYSASVNFTSLSAGSYVASISADGVFVRSSEFAVTGACASELPDTACENGGACNPTTGYCECHGDYSGPTCAVSPCAAKRCHPLASWCDITAGDEAVCVCRDGFTGALCDTLAAPGACAAQPACANGGWRELHQQRLRTADVANPSAGAEATCGACHCTHFWTGPDCRRCGLTCEAGGSPNRDCSACTCPAGYHGDRCELRHAVFTMNFRKTAAFDWYVPGAIDEPRLRAWAGEIEATVAALTSLSPTASTAAPALISHRRVNDTHGDEYLQIRLRVGSFPGVATQPESWQAYETLRGLRPLFTRPAGGARASSPVFKLPAFAALYLDRGVGMKDPNCDSTVELAVCPQGTLHEAVIVEWKPEAANGGEDDNESATSGSDTTAIAIGVGVGVGGLLVIAGLLYYGLRMKRPRSKHAVEEAQPAETQSQPGDMATV